MALLGKEKAELEARLTAPATPAVLADAGRQLKAIGDEITLLEGLWLELTEQIEANN
jgi:ATP-binding cassette, subfamily F, member 3